MVKLAHWKVDGCEFRHRALSVRPMSGLGQKADVTLLNFDVRFTPKSGLFVRGRTEPLAVRIVSAMNELVA
jgi:hypothetical protein